MAKEKKETKNLEQTLWDSCNKLRSTMSSTSYMYFVLGLVFLKFADLKFTARKEELIANGDKDFINIPSFYQEKNVFYLPEKARWEFIKNNAKQSDIGILIDDAFELLEKNNSQLKGSLPIGLYGKSTLPPANFSSLIDELEKVHTDDEHPMNDLIGKVYQYFLNKFAIKTADEKGEFYTPDNIVDLIVELIEPLSGKIYDPCCGSGGMFIQSYKFLSAHQGDIKRVPIYGQEANPDTWKLAKMNLAIRGISCDLGKINADTFTSDQHQDKTFDYIIANPSFNLKDWRGEKQLLEDARWQGYEVPPVSNANYGWILHMLSKLSENGMAGFLLANGALGSSGDEQRIRKNLIKNHKIEAIIVLPREMFYYTDISVTLWIMQNNKNARSIMRFSKPFKLRDRKKDILFMDLRTFGHKSNEGYTELSQNEVDKVKNTYFNWQAENWKEIYHDIPEFCKSVEEETLKSNNYSLVPSKYIEFIDHDLEIDYGKEMSRIQQEFKQLLKKEKESQIKVGDAFDGIGYGIK